MLNTGELLWQRGAGAISKHLLTLAERHLRHLHKNGMECSLNNVARVKINTLLT